MKLQKLHGGMLMLLCACMLQLSCSDKADSGGIAAYKSESGAKEATRMYWDGELREIHIQFATETGAVQASVVGIDGKVLHSELLETSVPAHVIPLRQAPEGDYTFVLIDSNDNKTSLSFTVR